jgi:hypothetical protein
MSSLPTNFRTCEHIKRDGKRCGSPALRRRRFCYFHNPLQPDELSRLIACKLGALRRWKEAGILR